MAAAAVVSLIGYTTVLGCVVEEWKSSKDLELLEMKELRLKGRSNKPSAATGKGDGTIGARLSVAATGKASKQRQCVRVETYTILESICLGALLKSSGQELWLGALAGRSSRELWLGALAESLKMSSTSSSSSSSTSTSSTENIVKSESESSSPQVGTSTPRIRVESSTPQASTSVPRRDALGDVKDEAEEKFDEDTWFTSDEKRNKMSKESIIELLEEFPLPPPFSARVPALQEPANYGTDLETSVYEGQIRSGYRIPMHPFAVAFFNYYKMAPGQLVPNGWRKLVGLIYLVPTSGYPVTVHDFLRLYIEVCFIKNVEKNVCLYYIHNRGRVIKGGPKSNKGWHSRYFFIQQRPSGKWEFPRKWNRFCKDYEKKGFLAPKSSL
ncbi:hypothetical protein RJ640_001209 [Escallonia rubra]|uniref:Transposase (putative) gypsy type domain-containing protein n=1 Tax=Escallonia rubra TaxID=112253 RepID=A0AA88UVP7_9ASTE|nr:hypothetical protein RJ640_001209 [Escallonia rubra]